MSRYRIFCLATEVETLSSEIVVEEVYPAFVIVSASGEVIEAVRKRYPVEKMTDPKPPPDVPAIAGLAAILTKPPKRGSHFRAVRFHMPVRQSWIEELEQTGCESCGAIGRSTIVVRCPNETSLAKLYQLSTHPRITPYVPHIQISPQFFERLKGRGDDVTEVAQSGTNPSTGRILSLPDILVANFFTEGDQQQAKRTLYRQGISKITGTGKTGLTIDLLSSKKLDEAMRMITAQRGLRSLERKGIIEPCNNEARSIIADRVVTPDPNSLGLTGKGEIVAVADSGLDTGDKKNTHPDFKGRVKCIQSLPIAKFWRYRVKDPDRNDGAADENDGHGTHVCGSILGDGTCSKALGLKSPIVGIAPEAQLVFQALEHKAEWNELGLDWWKNVKRQEPPSYYFLGIPDNLQDLFQEAYDQGARIHSNSWGEDQPEGYDQNSRALDQFIWEHKDFLVVAAAGNGGVAERHPNPPSSDIVDIITSGNISSPATAKNCLTVGATENERFLDDPNDHDEKYRDEINYGQDPQERWPNKPFKSDSMVDSKDDIAPLSSRGPVGEGRRKPDVVAPGTLVLSTRSSAISNEKNKFGRLGKVLGKFPKAPSKYMYSSGTSMSTALVAGCAALVRQCLREKKDISNPTAALLKATIIHSAQYRPYRYARPDSSRPADNEQGWGRVDLQQVLKPQSPTEVLFLDETDGLQANQAQKFSIEVTDDSVPLRITMVYTDRPGRALINNLNLFASDPSDTPFIGNDFTGSSMPDDVNNVEGIIVEKPQKGTWSICVTASNMPEGGIQDFALVISGGSAKLIYKIAMRGLDFST